MDQDINCLNFRGLFAFIRRRYSDEGIRQITEGLVNNSQYMIQDVHNPSKQLPIQEQHLVDPAYWVSNKFSLALFANVKKVIGGPNPLFKAGAGAARENLSNSALFAGRIFGPKFFARQAAKINARSDKTKDLRLANLTRNSALIEHYYRPNFRVSRDVCNWNLGLYTELANTSGVTHVKSKELKCVLDGHACCVFSLSWKRVNIIRRLLNGMFAWLIPWDIQDLISDREYAVRERDQLIDRLVESEKKYRTLFEDSMEAMCLTQGGKIVDTNPAWLQLHDYDGKADVIGTDVINFIHPDDRKILVKRRKNWPELKSRSYELRDIRKDGTPIDVELYTKGITLGDEKLILATIRDITELKQAGQAKEKLEAQLQRAQKMEALGTLAGGVAHDLNNILCAIVGYPDLLLMQIPEDSPLKKPIETIQATGKKAAAIVQDLLTLARRGVAVTEIVSLNEIISEYLKSLEFKKLASYHPTLEVEIRLDPNLPYIPGSPVHLAKTVMNLVSNAAEAMPGGGKVLIATENRYLNRPAIGFEEVAAGDYTTLTVSDTGIGISQADLERIFEPFYTKKVMGKSGTGLGMAVVWGTVKDHNGYIDLQSTEGQGTTFTLYFPVTIKKPAEDQSSLPLSAYRGKGETILIVDDVQEQREIASNILAKLGYSVTTRASGEEAVAYLNDHSVALIVLDMIMAPGIDGLETYKRIIKIHPGQKAIIASGFSETDSVRQAQKLGAGQYVKKPYTLETIGVAVRRELDA
jgi:PAS domain S-box-containing protein